MLVLAFLAAVAALTDPAAQEPPKQPPAPVRETVVVTAERGEEVRGEVPAATSVLTREEIARLPAETLADLLDFLPGFHAFFAHIGAGTAPMVTARGFFGGGEAEYVQLRIDGVAVADPESGIADWRSIRAENIDRIEALRGPASSLYGDTALGGVVEVFTRNPAADGVASSASVSGGSFGFASADGSIRGARSGREATISASVSRSDGERSHAAAETRGVESALSTALGSGRLSLRLSGTSLRREDPGALTLAALDADPTASDPAFRFDREDTRRGRASIEWNASEGPLPLRASLDLGSRRTRLVRALPLAPDVFDRTRRDIDSWDAGAAVSGTTRVLLPAGGGQLRFGAEARRESLDGAYRPVEDDGVAGPISAAATGHRDRTALFLQQDWKPAKRLRLVAGLRWDRIADRFRGDASGSAVEEAWSPRLGLTMRLGPSSAPPLSLFAAASRAFKAPTLDQLFDPHPFPDFRGGSFLVSNPGLRPQRAETFEIGASRETRNLNYEAALYRTAVREEIDFDPRTFRYVNIGESLHTGVELSARYKAAGVGALALEPFASWAWTRVVAREGENAGRQLKNVPRHIVRVGLAATLAPALRAEAVATAMAGRYLDDANRFSLGDFVTVDLRVERRFGSLAARLDVWNVADARTREIGYALTDFRGRDIPYAYPGARRSLRAGLVLNPGS